MQQDLIHRIVRIAEKNHGHVPTERARAAGASKAWLHRQVAAGWMQHDHRDGFRIGPRTLDHDRCAGVDIGGAGSMIVGEHGLDMWRIRTVDVRNQPVRIWTPTHRRSRDGKVFTSLPWIQESDARIIDGIAVASREICIATVATTFDAVDLVAFIKEACFRDREVADRLDELVRTRSFAGAVRASTALDWYDAGHCGFDSATERRVRKRLKELGAPDPVINGYVCLRDGQLKIDMYWPDAGLVGEVNPDGHKRPWVKLGDLGRRARCERDGLQVIDLDMTRSLAYQDQVLRELAFRAHQARRGPLVPVELPRPTRRRAGSRSH